MYAAPLPLLWSVDLGRMRLDSPLHAVNVATEGLSTPCVAALHIWGRGRQRDVVSADFIPAVRLCKAAGADVQEYPELQKQPKWDSKLTPDKVDWDAEIKAALEKGKDVPEVTWVKPGEEEAMKVGSSMAQITSLFGWGDRLQQGLCALIPNHRGFLVSQLTGASLCTGGLANIVYWRHGQYCVLKAWQILCTGGVDNTVCLRPGKRRHEGMLSMGEPGRTVSCPPPAQGL